MEIKPKINKWDLIKFKSFCAVKGTIKKEKRQLTEWEKNICKWCDWQGINLQNIQTAHTALYQKTNSPIKKWAEWDFPGGPVVKNSPCNAGDAGSIPGQGTKIPHVAWPKEKRKKRKKK